MMLSQKQSVLTLLTLLLLSSVTPVRAAREAEASDDLTKLSLEDLMNIDVYSATKKKQRFWDTAAAIDVISPEDIRRSGATNIPELLRMVPGVTVQKLDSNSWDISARGFNGSIFANKLLVLIDGRAVYTPLYGGVFWDVQDVVLEDIERVEVIRGPGGTLWGANAVNGVVNIITKKAKDTQGTLISAGVGNEIRGSGTLRHGAQTGDWFYRSYVKYFNRDEGYRNDGNNVDEWEVGRTGFRAEKEKWSMQGDFYEGNIGQRTSILSFTPPFTQANNETADVRGGNLLTKYEEEDWLAQMYWDVTYRNSISFEERRDKIDLEYVRHLALTDAQQISWGLGYRLELEDFKDTTTLAVHEPARTDQIFSFFVHDAIDIIEDKFKITVGSKFEHNIYTGFEVQPNVIAQYQLNENSMMWSSISRAVRTPSRLETDGEITAYAPTLGGFVRTLGSHDLESEELIAYEAGYRNQLTDNMLIDVAAYANHYDDLSTFDFGSTITDNGVSILTLPTVNGMKGQVHGLEVSTQIRVLDWWRIKGNYTISKMTLHTDSDTTDFGLEKSLEHSYPRHTVYIRNSFDLAHDIEFDATLRYMDAHRDVPAVIEVDLNLMKDFNGWQVAIVGQNLVESHHKEAIGATATEVERSGYIKVTREF